jgi:hypothetical protein
VGGSRNEDSGGEVTLLSLRTASAGFSLRLLSDSKTEAICSSETSGCLGITRIINRSDKRKIESAEMRLLLLVAGGALMHQKS